MLNISVVDLGRFYNMILEKTGEQQEIEEFKTKKVGLNLIPTKIFKTWNLQFNNSFFSFHSGTDLFCLHGKCGWY